MDSVDFECLYISPVKRFFCRNNNKKEDKCDYLDKNFEVEEYGYVVPCCCYCKYFNKRKGDKND